MSYTEIFIFNRYGKSSSYAKMQNSWRGAMEVWKILGEKYIGQEVTSFQIDRFQKIWDLVDNPEVPVEERIVLFTTLDGCLTRRNNLLQVIKAFRGFRGDTSLPEQADILEEIYNTVENCMAVGWHQNSISCDKWHHYNCIRKKEHFFLFDELKLEESTDFRTD